MKAVLSWARETILAILITSVSFAVCGFATIAFWGIVHPGTGTPAGADTIQISHAHTHVCGTRICGR